ncbi:MAG: hypothetical protein ACRENJ_01105 [Candidatus Eiseniibacteriota bacterium]
MAAVFAVVAVPAARGGASRLSDAAKQAVKPPAEQRPLAGGDRDPAIVVAPSIGVSIGAPYPAPCPSPYPQPYPAPYPEPYYEPDAEPYGGDPGPPRRSRFDELHVGTVVTIGSLSSPDFAPYTLYGLRIGTNDSRRTSLDLVLSGGPYRFAAGSDIGNAFRDPRELGLEGSVRYSLTQGRAGLGIAPVAGFRVGRLAWRYLNEIQIESGGVLRDVRDDNLWHYSSSLGVALTFMRVRHLDLGVTALTGWRFYRGESGEGLTNDLFLQDRYNELRLETRVVL